jgi:hypothetical protein
MAEWTVHSRSWRLHVGIADASESSEITAPASSIQIITIPVPELVKFQDLTWSTTVHCPSLKQVRDFRSGGTCIE